MGNALMSASGGLTNSKLSLADAEATDVRPGKKFYSKDKIIKTGNMETKNSETKEITPTFSPQSYTFQTNDKLCTGDMIVNVAAKNVTGSGSLSPGVNHDNWVNGHKAVANTTIYFTISGNKIRIYGSISSWLDGNESGGGATANFDQSFTLT